MKGKKNDVPKDFGLYFVVGLRFTKDFSGRIADVNFK